MLQVYATPSALDHREDAFHRMLYVFISLQVGSVLPQLSSWRVWACTPLSSKHVWSQGNQLSKEGAVKAFRCQLPRRNDFYSFDPPAKSDLYPTKPIVRSLNPAAQQRNCFAAQGQARHRYLTPGQLSNLIMRRTARAATSLMRSRIPGVCWKQSRSWHPAHCCPVSSGVSSNLTRDCAPTSVCCSQRVRSQQHLKRCMSVTAAPEGVRIYPEQELVIEAEEDAAVAPTDDQSRRYAAHHRAFVSSKLPACWGRFGPCRSSRRLLQQYQDQLAAHGEGAPEELTADVLSAVESNIPLATRHFAEFAAAVSRAPEQVSHGRFNCATPPEAVV